VSRAAPACFRAGATEISSADSACFSDDSFALRRPSGATPRPAHGSTQCVVKSPLVLLADDDARTREHLRTTLTDEHLRVVETASGAEALSQAAAHNPDLVLLDLALPDLDGIQVTTMLRSRTATPILVLSANTDELRKIAAFEAGANDYVTKPVATGELLARMRVWLRLAERTRADSLDTVVEAGDLRVDLAAREAYHRGERVPLTPTQFKLFAAFMREAGKVLTHEHLTTLVWGAAAKKQRHYLRVYVGQLRKKFELGQDDPCRYFASEPGIGYRLTPR
jgi:two-component system KDP operon response regulator KdpE